MTILRLFALAGLAAASLGAATVADAQHHRDDHRGYERRYDHHRDYRDHHRDRRHGYGRDRCRTEVRHHRRVRICR